VKISKSLAPALDLILEFEAESSMY
jgi:hypothetical protein